jgi:hypothetical protein
MIAHIIDDREPAPGDHGVMRVEQFDLTSGGRRILCEEGNILERQSAASWHQLLLR